MKKPTWVIEKERAKRASSAETLWLFGLHAVRDALMNPAREKLRLVLTRNAADRLAEAIAQSGMEVELSDPRKFAAPLEDGAVHQGAALEVRPLDWGRLRDLCEPGQARAAGCRKLVDHVLLSTRTVAWWRRFALGVSGAPAIACTCGRCGGDCP